MTKTRRITRKQKIEQHYAEEGVPEKELPIRAPRMFHIQPKNRKQQALLESIREYPITVSLS